MNAIDFFPLFLKANLRMTQRRISQLRQQSMLMMAVILLFVTGYWVGAYCLVHWGLGVLVHEFAGLGVLLVDRMLYLFFAFLFLMLIFSNMIIGYSSLYESQETQWMLTLPVRHSDVFSWKLAETMVLASWAFVFLATPLMFAYGMARQVGGLFYLKVFLLLLPFMILTASLGALAVLLIARYFQRRAFKWGLCAMAMIGVLLAVAHFHTIHPEGTQEAALGQLLRSSHLTLKPVLPSYWVASGVIAWGEKSEGRGAFFFLVLLSNALMGMLVCVGISGRMFYSGWSRTQSQGGFPLSAPRSGRPVVPLLHRLVDRLPGIDPITRALAIKDIRTFCRDISQWSQFAIFFGLLALHVVNMRNFAYDWNNEFWAAFVSFLNLGATSMTLATLTTRFVYPQFSLEGKRLWLVGMAPDGLRRMLLEKFWLSSAVSVAITLSLTLGSSWLRGEPPWMALLLGATVVLMSFALSGIAVGTGALFPNFGSGSTANRRDDNPAKIVSGFGGTFCFVLSLAYILLVIGGEALPFYFYLPWVNGANDTYGWAVVGSWVFTATISLVAAAVPMSLALKRVESLEF
jgi:ABC-2 type transport system permease protein